MTRVWKDLTFDAAHRLTGVPDGHPCRALHGHTYYLRVIVEGDIGKDGFVQDFARIKALTWQVLHYLDHRDLNDVFVNPTVELMSQWIFRKLREELPSLVEIHLQEGRNNGCIYSE